eukprot:TRINITY_DN1398_c0_g1_i2.p2 TRINITY_DN1398_c0_g1~~TRINITY_DN1398_c0_g1_i2.p2  ORF type:complete len:248 (-),score=33.84 TRINITY_DN1398_c0_g1_i2:771-1514(-)
MWRIPIQDQARKMMIQSMQRHVEEPSSACVRSERLCWDLNRAAEGLRVRGQKMTLVLDSGGHQLWALRNWHCSSFSEVLSSNTFASMGIGLPAAIGAANAIKTKHKAAKRKVVCLFGDGGWIMNLQEMETATRLNLDLVVIIWINNSLGLVEWGDLTDFGDRMDFKFGNPDVHQLAASFGWSGATVRAADDLLPTLQSALSRAGRSLIYVHMEPTSDLEFSDQLIRDCVLRPAHLEEGGESVSKHER